MLITIIYVMTIAKQWIKSSNQVSKKVFQYKKQAPWEEKNKEQQIQAILVFKT